MGLGLPFPPTAERFERLEETLQICLQMWSDDDGPYEGKHYRLGRTLNSPQPCSGPHPPILIGGGGEKKTLRLVAQYAQACNLFAFADARAQARRAARALRGRRPRLRRDREDGDGRRSTRAPTARRSTSFWRTSSASPASVSREAHGWVPAVQAITPLEVLGERVIPEAAKF